MQKGRGNVVRVGYGWPLQQRKPISHERIWKTRRQHHFKTSRSGKYRGAAAVDNTRCHYPSFDWPAPSHHQNHLRFHVHVAHSKTHASHKITLTISLPHIHTTHLLIKTIEMCNTALATAMERSTSSTSITSVHQVLRDALASDFSRVESRGKMPERRPSIVVNEDGCIVQRGFFIPNRTSPSHPRTARTACATYKPIRGFPRPTGSLFDAPELRILAKKHPESLHRPTKSAGDLEHMAHCDSKPFMGERRQTWQSCTTSIRWTNEELAGVMCKPSSTHQAHHNAPFLAMGRRDRTMQMHRTPNVQVDLHTLGKDQSRKDSTTRQRNSHDKRKSEVTTKEDITLVPQADAEDAIASDSDADDDDVLTDAELKQRSAAQRKRPGYAERRSKQDERAAEELNRRVAEYDARPEQQAPLRVRLTRTDQHESAIESDSEEEDEQVTSALRTATVHRYHNQIEASQGAAGSQIEDAVTQSPCKRSDNRASLNVKITSEPVATLAITGNNAKGGVTPRVVKSFEVDAPQRCGNLRPSSSRPRPAKGVLKKTDSPSSSSSSSGSPTKHVKTVKRRTFTSRCMSALTPSFMAIQNYWPTPRTQQQSQQYQQTDPSGQAE